MAFRRLLRRRKTAESDDGGILANGPFMVRLSNFKLVYKVTTVLGFRSNCCKDKDKDADYNIGVNLIRQWDEPVEPLSKDLIAAIRANIWRALDYMRIRYSNVR
jgi:hypothetical protein